MHPRIVTPKLLELARYYPVVALAGPRQAGKTTLAKNVFPHKAYMSLEDPDVRAFAATDPRSFLDQFPDGAVLDEIQRAPELFSYLQTRVDADGRMGLFVITGSQQFGLMENISQSLAGRVGFVHLLPFAWAEMAPFQPATNLEEVLWRGFYPPIHDRAIPPHIWFADYLATYIERDVRRLIQVRDLAAFHRFVLMCASRSGQLLNLSALAADCGITHNTAGAWLGVLEASFLLMRLPPYHRNFGKRLTKTPKLYFLDTGLAAWLSGVRDPRELVSGNMRGPLFETFVIAEFVKNRNNRLGAESLYFWRDSAGNEVDLLIEEGSKLTAIECKSGRTVADDWFRPLRKFADLVKPNASFVIHGGDSNQQRSDIPVLSWRQSANGISLA